MYELIVLGFIPGTQMQISFGVWLVLTTILVAAMLFWKTHRLDVFHTWFIAWRIAHTIRRQKFSAASYNF